MARQYLEERIAKEPENQDWLELYLVDILLVQNEISTDDAETVYMEMLGKDPLNVQAKLGISKILITKKEYDKAESLVEEILNKEPRNIEALFLKGEILEAEREYLTAYKLYEEILKLYPDSQIARNLKYKALLSMGANSLVIQKLEESGDVIDPALRDMLWGNEAMSRIWWGEPDIALETLKKNMDYAEEKHLSLFLLRTRYDEILALRQKDEMVKVIEEYENLKDMNAEIPPWVIVNTADAYLYLKQPEQALLLYEEALQKQWDPLYGETRMSIYATEVELGNYKEAGDILDELDKKTPVQTMDRGILQDTWWKEEVAYNRGWWYLYQDRLAEGNKYLKELLYNAPANTHMRTALAHTYLWRGWPRRALEEFEITRTITIPTEDVATEVGYCYALDENDRGIEARNLAKELLKQYPTNLYVQRLNRYFEVQDMRTLTFDAVVTNEKPGAHETYCSLKLEQSIYPWRKIFGMYIWQHTSQEDLEEYIRRTAVGIDWRLNRDWWFIGTLSSEEHDNSLGFAGEITFNPNDYLSFNAMYDSDSLTVPLQARPLDIEAEESRFIARYRQSESFLSELTADFYQMSDGNDISGYTLRLDKALTTRAHWKTRVALEGYISTSSETDVGYYSPENFYSIYLIPMVEHTWYRSEDRALVDRLYIGIGTQKETEFSEKGVWYARYEQDYKISDTLTFLIGTSFSKNNYSGEYTDVGNFYLTLIKNF